MYYREIFISYWKVIEVRAWKVILCASACWRKVDTVHKLCRHIAFICKVVEVLKKMKPRVAITLKYHIKRIYWPSKWSAHTFCICVDSDLLLCI